MLDWLLLAFFLPLFPLSSVFVLLFQRVKSSYLKALLLLVWPQVGLWLASNTTETLPEWIMLWGVATALLYGFRSLVIKELYHWIAFLSITSWSVFWVLIATDISLELILLGVSLSLALLTLLGREIDHKQATVYTGVISGLAHGRPKLAGLITLSLLLIIGTPLAPNFFNYFALIGQQFAESTSITFMLVLIWFFVSWSGIRLYQQLMTGDYSQMDEIDIGMNSAVAYTLVIMTIIGFGLFFGGALI